MAIQIRRGTNAQWESNKSNIVAGEPAITTDTGRFFVGTGSGTYQEYAQATRTVNGHPLTSNVEVFAQDIPSKNLLPNKAHTQTINGVTFTTNADGSVTVNGTASGNALFWLLGNQNATMTLPSGTYTLSGCPSGGTSSTYRLSVYNNQGIGYQHDYGSGGNFPSLDGGMKFAIVVFSGATVSNKVFYPMVRPSSITDGTYVPYAMTNVELTQKFAFVQIACNLNELSYNASGTATGYLEKTWDGYDNTKWAIAGFSVSSSGINDLSFIQIMPVYFNTTKIYFGYENRRTTSTTRAFYVNVFLYQAGNVTPT